MAYQPVPTQLLVVRQSDWRPLDQAWAGASSRFASVLSAGVLLSLSLKRCANSPLGLRSKLGGAGQLVALAMAVTVLPIVVFIVGRGAMVSPPRLSAIMLAMREAAAETSAAVAKALATESGVACSALPVMQTDSVTVMVEVAENGSPGNSIAMTIRAMVRTRRMLVVMDFMLVSLSMTDWSVLLI